MTRTGSLLACLAIVGCVLIALGGSLAGDFVWDDRPLILDNPGVKDAALLPSLLTSSFWQTNDRHDRFRAFYRPAVLLTYAFDHAVWGRRPFGFHLANLVLHALCCLLVYHLARSEGLGQLASAAGACLFAAHPVHVESVAWISGRTDLLCSLFMLLAFAAHRAAAWDRSGGGPTDAAERGLQEVRGVHRAVTSLAGEGASTDDRSGVRPAPRRARRLALRGASLACFALALACKEMAATLPLLVFAERWFTAEQWFRSGSRRDRAWAAVRSAWPYAPVFVLYLLARWAVLGGGGEMLYVLGPVSWVATAIFVLARDATLLLYPVGLDAHYPYPPRTGLLEPAVLLSLAILGIVAVSGWRLARRAPRAAFWLAWIPLSLLPTLLFGAFGDVLLADRFLYAPSVGLAVLLAAGLQAAIARPGHVRRLAPRIAVALGCAVIGVFALSSAARARTWKDDLTLFRTMVRTSPGSAMVHANLGLALYDRASYPAAKAEFMEAVRLVPGYAMAHNNLAASLEREGLLGQALAQYREALRLAPGQLESRINIGGLLVRLGRTEEGLSILHDVASEHPRYPQALYTLADSLDRVGRWEESLDHLRTARRIDPGFASPHYLIGKILFAQRRYEEAAGSMRSFLRLWTTEGPHRQAALRVIARAPALPSPALPDSPVPHAL